MGKLVDNLLGRQFGNYRLVRLLGRGGFASVYLGENIYINTLVAVKVLHTEIEQPSDMERFRFEARTIANLKHPHIVQLIDFGLEDRMPYLVMSYAPYGHLRQLQALVETFSLPSVVSYVKQAASALQFAHDHKIIHRDIKPENLLLDVQDSLLLSDFGIALIAQTTHQPNSEGILGTLAYMAPEQTQGKAVPASDQYALGVIAYELLTGVRPFDGSLAEIVAQHFSAPPPPLREKLPTLPVSVEQVILRSLAKNPQERFPSVSAFAEALEKASEPQATLQDPSAYFYQADPLSRPAPQSFEEKLPEQASFSNEEEKGEYAQFANIAHGLEIPSLEATPTVPFPPEPDAIVPPDPLFISAFLPDQTYSQIPTLLVSPASPFVSPASPVSFAQAETFPVGQNFLLGKHSHRLLNITLICVMILILGSAIFLVYSVGTHMGIQAGFIKEYPIVPTVSSQQPLTTKAKSTSMAEKSTSVPTVTRKLISTATATTLALVPLPTAIPTAIPSPTPTPGACSSFTGYYKIVNVNSGKNLDVMNDATNDGAGVVQFTDNGRADQQWSFVATSAGYCKIVNRNSGDLINIPSYTNNQSTQLIQYHDDGGVNSQWKLVAVGNGPYKIISRYDNQCLDVSGDSFNDGATVVQFPDNGGLNQQWQLVQV